MLIHQYGIDALDHNLYHFPLFPIDASIQIQTALMVFQYPFDMDIQM